MAAAVAVPLSAINGEHGGVLPPSAVVQHSPRHGRSRGMSMKDRDVAIAKALMFVIKRAVKKIGVEEGDDGEYLLADPEGWVSVSDVLAHSRISNLSVSLEDVQRIIANATKARFDLRQVPETDGKSDDPASWQISSIGTRDSVTSPVPVGDKLTAETEELPEFVIYETSYQRYPILLASGAITRAPGGSEYLSFCPVTVDEDGNESRQNPGAGDAAEVSVWIHLRSALQAEPGISWQRSDSGMVITTDEVPKSLWKKAVARRPDIGVLFEDGEVRKEVPANLRGKGAKGKGRKGKMALPRDGSGDDSGSASEE
ncbi:tRNA 2'-phosphotransferase 1 [Madurella mycetomatis]|uniref:2'-phosphotransferase n=1 Tax=Madurella mycetomatis TaxID=100816 RepID=A0A175W8X9_9PEZI|nr:tRNA 2'-phosphotransferase 1 [Madurella mycetomatis]KXX82910.1 tRNA 2'-phosphotransferase 1 [Madurella mycetomatis]